MGQKTKHNDSINSICNKISKTGDFNSCTYLLQKHLRMYKLKILHRIES